MGGGVSRESDRSRRMRIDGLEALVEASQEDYIEQVIRSPGFIVILEDYEIENIPESYADVTDTINEIREHYKAEECAGRIHTYADDFVLEK